jgi:crotonobetainyl-CoA:carnitine CoA-transferase CaiB-like acyl-CoA transferase
VVVLLDAGVLVVVVVDVVVLVVVLDVVVVVRCDDSSSPPPHAAATNAIPSTASSIRRMRSPCSATTVDAARRPLPSIQRPHASHRARSYDAGVTAYDGLLTGVRVLDLSIWRPGPYCTQLLADLGADVLKVEPPGGDPMRVFTGLFATINANKRSVVLDLKDDADRDRALDLAAEADVLVEGYRPGVAARLGMGYEQVSARNPSIVYCSISGFGQDGPLATMPGHDLNYQAYAGMLLLRSDEPEECTVPVADLAGGTFGALAVCAALTARTRTGDGEHIDVSMTDVLATWTGPFEANAIEGSDQPMKGLPSYGAFRTKDGQWVTLGIIAEDHFWRHLCDQLGIDGVRDLDMHARVDRIDELRALVTDAIAARTRDEIIDALGDGTAIAPALTRREMLEHPQMVERGLTGLTTPGGFPTMGYPVSFGRRPARDAGVAPTVGQHQDEGFLTKA